MKKYKHFILYETIAVFLSLSYSADAVTEKLTDRVNMFLGTNSSAQTSPSAIRPFGMISPGPFNKPQAPCGYSMRNAKLIGFNHTHLQGTGCGSYGVLVLLPVTGEKRLGTVVTCPSNKQSAEPGYFKAVIDEMNIMAEMTCTKRVAIHRYTFPESNAARVLIDLSQGIPWAGNPAIIRGHLSPVGPRALSGSVTTSAWREHTTYFYIQFSDDFQFTSEDNRGGYVTFKSKADTPIHVKAAISYVSQENAKMNMETELPDWDFDNVRKEALDEWNGQLGKIEVKGGTENQQVNFYSAMYHVMFHPQTFNDVNGQYLGMDDKIHTADGHNHYSILSTWDTFRAVHPLYILINPDIQLDIIKTMIDDYNNGGWGPLWKLANKETAIMPGTWADVIIPDTYIKGITNFDVEIAWKLVYKNATVPGRRESLEDYLKMGYVPYPVYINASRTLEYAYCDFAIGRFAAAIGKDKLASEFYERAKNYRKLWDTKTKFFRGRDISGNWSYSDNFDPFVYTGKGNNDYCEGNAWQWLWHIMHDTQGLINLMGGDQGFKAKLDEFLAVQGGKHGTKTWGQYWHGNEPDQHALYAYNYIGVPAKTAEKIRLCLETEYKNDPWGMSGNEDAGQMSAWYIFSAIGFYPYIHAIPEYVIGSPIFDEVTMNLAGGKFIIKANNNSAENKYIQSIILNGKNWDKTFLPNSAVINGGMIEFNMGLKPSVWGTSEDSRPYSMTPRIQYTHH